MKVFTLGYQTLSSDLYVRTLVNAGVGIVLDVRERAWSQRPEFVKGTLNDALYVAGIRYIHVKAAGNPAQNRKTARSAAECLTRYRIHLKTNVASLHALLTEIRAASGDGRPACLTCYERIYTDCHRSVLIEELQVLAPEIVVVHLEPSVAPKKANNRIQRAITADSPFGSAFLAQAFLPFI